MDITRLAIDRGQLMLLLTFTLIVTGFVTFYNMPRAQDPAYPIRVATVTTVLAGASADRVEQLLTEPLEKVIQEMPEIHSITSTSRSGVSTITVNIHDRYTNLQPIWEKLKSKVDKVQVDFPAGTERSKVDDEIGDMFGIAIGIVSDGFSYAEQKKLADQLRNELLAIDLVAKVELYGAQEERIFVEYNSSQLTELGISPEYFAQVLDKKNIITPGGRVRREDVRLNIETTGNVNSIDELKRTLVPLPSSEELISLDNIAKVYRAYIDPPKEVVRVGGHSGMVVAVSMREGGNIIRLGEQVSVLLSEFREVIPLGFEFEVVAFQPQVVNDTIVNFALSLLQAISIVCLVIIVFLGLKTGLVVASLIPVTVLGTIVIMNSLDIGLNQVSLAGLMIALGMLVDNAIVMTENILVLRSKNIAPIEAAVRSAKQLRWPLLVASLTTAAAFLPIALADSATGEYTAPLFHVVSIALLFSWVVSLTLIPLLTVVFLAKKHSPRTSRVFNPSTYAAYTIVLKSMLQHRVATLLSVGLIFIVAIFSFRFVPVIFFPASDDARFKLEIDLPQATSIEHTASVVGEIEKFIDDQLMATEQRQGVTNYTAFIGTGGPRVVTNHSGSEGSSNTAFLLFNTSSSEPIEQLMEQLRVFLFEYYPDISASIRRFETGASVAKPIQIRISGESSDTLYTLSDQIKLQLESMSGTVGIKDDWGPKAQKIVINVDEAAARRAGITNADVASSLNTSFSGKAVTEYREGDQLIPVVVRAQRTVTNQASLTNSMNIFSQTGNRSYNLSELGSVLVAWEPALIKRYDLERTITISAELSRQGNAADIVAILEPWLERLFDRPEYSSYEFALGGEAEASAEANQSINEKIPVAFAIILFLLMTQFNSIKKTAIILLTIPLGLIGVVSGLLITGSYFGFMTFLGIISLSGIVINNAIVLIDRIEFEMINNGLARGEAIVVAAQRRLRPIVLTTLTTLLGMMPLWLGGGTLWETMAVTIIFGLLGGTLLTLGVVPVLYALFYGVKLTSMPEAKGMDSVTIV
ncbi:MAG: efflux RND transporter permease subunit [Pseudomonadales bacterium]|nr:efflux RND transporter permease subunit [Pseudomonadales bacterium]